MREFLYDGVFSEVSRQDEVYEQIGLPVLEQTMRGMNGCILAYGPTGAGKSALALAEHEISQGRPIIMFALNARLRDFTRRKRRCCLRPAMLPMKQRWRQLLAFCLIA